MKSDKAIAITCGILLALAVGVTAAAGTGEDPDQASPVIPEIETTALAAVWEGTPAPTGPERILAGTYTVTAYCPCAACCGQWSNPENPVTASGAPAVEGITVGADWDTLPPGTVIEIEGVGVRTVQDKPAAWIIDRYDGHILDLYFANHADAVNFGRREAQVWILK